MIVLLGNKVMPLCCQVMVGLGKPLAWQAKVAVCPTEVVTSEGVVVKRGCTETKLYNEGNIMAEMLAQ